MVNNLEMNQNRPKSDEESVRDFQRKLYRKAKQERMFRFYVLYDKIYMSRFLRVAYRLCRKNKGAAGVDGITFREIEDEIGIGAFLIEIEKELKENTYKPQPVRRVYIEKANGKLRPLGIATIKDRVVQMACKLVIEPIFEADFEKESYGFRPKKSAKDAIKQIKVNLQSGKTELLDVDLRSYFDTIPHKELMMLVGKRISDRKVLHLIKMWLKAPVIDEDGKLTGGKKNKLGCPQGAVLSPLLSNIYLNILDKAVNRKNGCFKRKGAVIVRYADDFVIMAGKITSDLEWYLTGLLERMKLTINREKTKKVKAKEESFDFLGFTIRHDWSWHRKNWKFWNIIPSKKALLKFQRKIRDLLKQKGYLSPQKIVGELNPKIRGWLNYFNIPKTSYPGKVTSKLKWYLAQRIYQFYKRKSQRKGKLHKQGAMDLLIRKYGLVDPVKYLYARKL